jgi:NADH-quinone oxidoreductase subunit N
MWRYRKYKLTDKTMTNFLPAYPEIFLLLATCLILLIDLFVSDAKRNLTHYLSLLTIVFCAGLTMSDWEAGQTFYIFNNMFISDPLSCLLKLFAYLSVGMVLIYSRQYNLDRGMVGGELGGEFYVLALFSLLGQMVMIAANNVLIIYLGLELMSLALYTLVALRRDHIASIEAAMKYFVLGALASGFLLYGISMLYGVTGTLDLSGIARVSFSEITNKTMLVFALVFIVAGLAFKLGAAPFHMWAPDVYQGAPTGVTLLLGAAPKLAAFAICFRLLVEGLFIQAVDWQQMLMVLSVLSMVVGNVAALAQTNLKRMLAYSTISHMGFMLLGLLSGVFDGYTHLAAHAYASSLFYVITYVITTLGTFGVILLLTRRAFESEQIDDLKGLYKRSPWFAFVMLMLMFSLAGIPPFIGFYAKFVVLQAVLSTGQVWLAIVAVVCSLIGAYYYLRVIKVMYFDEPVEPALNATDGGMRLMLSLNGVAVIALGLMPASLMNACLDAITQTLIA